MTLRDRDSIVKYIFWSRVRLVLSYMTVNIAFPFAHCSIPAESQLRRGVKLGMFAGNLYMWVKWAPNLASFDAAFCDISTHARQASAWRYILVNLGPASPHTCALLSLWSSMFRDDLVDHKPILRPQPSVRGQMACHLSPPPSSLGRTLPQYRPPMAILRSSYKEGKTKPQVKSIEQLVSRLGQRSQLLAP